MHVSKTNQLKKSSSVENVSKNPMTKPFTYDARRKSLQKSNSSDMLLAGAQNSLCKMKSTSCENLDSLNHTLEHIGSKNEEIDSLIIDKLKLDSSHLSRLNPQKMFNEEQMEQIINFVKINSPGVIYDFYTNRENMIQSPEEMAHILKDHITESVISGIVNHVIHNM